MIPKSRSLVLAAVASAILLGAPGVAFATAPDGAAGTELGRGLADEKVKTRAVPPYDVVVQSITIAPGGHTGWHTHPGIAVAVVKTGSLTIYDGDDKSCSGDEYVAGQTYVDPGNGHVHIGRNEGGVATEVLVTYFDVPNGGAVRIDIDDPGNCAEP